MDIRFQEIQQWLAQSHDLQAMPDTLRPASADASFRRYFRVQTSRQDHPTLIIMDAPPPKEDVRPFVDVAQRLGQCGVSVPEILAQDIERGFLALTDFGSTTYLSVLGPDNARTLYENAFDALVRFQVAAPVNGLAKYDDARLQAEMELFPMWYVQKHLGVALSDDERNQLAKVFEVLSREAQSQAQVLVHRDYHSRNLMVIAHDSVAAKRGLYNPGILDFQDAVEGPITYDLVSLLRDAYIQWDEEEVLDWAIRYWQAARVAGLPVHSDPSEFYRQFEWMGLQRHLKVLGIFARLYHRDGKDGYLNDIPLVMHYTRKVAHRFGAFKPLARLLDKLEGIEVKTGYTF